MATPGEFVKVMAEALGVPAETVVVHDRNLVVAGLRSKGGRGRSAAHVTPRDAAHLLTALLASAQVRDSASSVERYSTTRPLPASGASGWRKSRIKELASLPAEHSFVDALEAIIAAAANGSLAAVLGEASATSPAIIEVAALTPGTIGDIRIAGLPGEATISLRYAQPTPWDKTGAKQPSKRELAAWETKMKKRMPLPDLEQYRRISARTIASIGEAIRLKERKP